MCPNPWLHTSLDDIRLQVITIPPTAEFSALLILVNQRHVSPASSFIYKGDLIILRRVSTSACFSRSSNRHFCLFWLFTHLARSSKDFQWPRKPSCVCLRWLMGFKKQVYHPCSRVPYHFPFLRYDAGNNNKVYHNTFIPEAGFFSLSLEICKFKMKGIPLPSSHFPLLVTFTSVRCDKRNPKGSLCKIN